MVDEFAIRLLRGQNKITTVFWRGGCNVFDMYDNVKILTSVRRRRKHQPYVIQTGVLRASESNVYAARKTEMPCVRDDTAT